MWLDETAADRMLLEPSACPTRNVASCLRLAIDRHRIELFEPVVPADMRQVRPPG